MARFDTEQVLKAALSVVKLKLNPEITLINAEKGDFTLDPVNDKAYYFASMPKGAFNYNPFVVYGFLANPTTESAQPDNSIKSIELYFEIVLVDSGAKDEENIIYKLLRYSRSLEEIFNKNHDKIMQGFGNIQVTSLSPTTIFNLDGKIVRSAGVSVTAKITAR